MFLAALSILWDIPADSVAQCAENPSLAYQGTIIETFQTWTQLK